MLFVLPVARPLHRRARSLDLRARLSHPLIVVLVLLSVYRSSGSGCGSGFGFGGVHCGRVEFFSGKDGAKQMEVWGCEKKKKKKKKHIH